MFIRQYLTDLRSIYGINTSLSEARTPLNVSRILLIREAFHCRDRRMILGIITYYSVLSRTIQYIDGKYYAVLLSIITN